MTADFQLLLNLIYGGLDSGQDSYSGAISAGRSERSVLS